MRELFHNLVVMPANTKGIEGGIVGWFKTELTGTSDWAKAVVYITVSTWELLKYALETVQDFHQHCQKVNILQTLPFE